jgi:DNA-directed RNA polymerase subunit RPC12/RpoP
MIDFSKLVGSKNIGFVMPDKKLYVCMDCHHRWKASSWLPPQRCPECGGKSVTPDPLGSIILW